MNPTLNPARIEAELAADPEAAAEWHAVFRTDISAFIPLELVEAVTIPGRYELPKIEGVQYFAFTDPSGGRQDSFTLAISHRDPASGRIVLDVLHERRPPFSPETVTQEFADVLKGYALDQVHGDKYAGSWVSSSFEKFGILFKASEKTASELYLEALPLLTTGAVELLDSKRIKGQLANLERRTRAGGRDLITHGPGLHDDCANAAAGALVLAAQEAGVREGRVMAISGRTISSSSEKPDDPGQGGKVFASGSDRSPGLSELDLQLARARRRDEILRQRAVWYRRPPESKD